MDFLAVTIARTDARYPRRLRDVPDPPEWLKVRGRIPDSELAVAIVGARAARREQQRAAHDLAYQLARRGTPVVSGGALGVDAAAHRGALAAASEPDTPISGTSIAVLGCGLDVIYPEQHAELYRELGQRGALVSQFVRNAPPRAWHFARRNRTMAALADAIVVIGAGAHSGALRTAQAGREYGRLVAAMPGSPGCEALIASGAATVRDLEDLERALSGRPVRPTAVLPEPESAPFRVLDQLAIGEIMDVDQIAARAGLGVRVVQRALTQLELDGLVLPRPGFTFERSLLAQDLLKARGARG